MKHYRALLLLAAALAGVCATLAQDAAAGGGEAAVGADGQLAVIPEPELRISVVIPAHLEYLRHIPRALESVLASSRLPEEIIISISELDDAQAEELRSMAQTLAQGKGVAIRVLHVPHKRLAGGNRNAGALAATGDMIVFHDADDIMHPQKCEIVEMVSKEVHPAMLLHSYDKDATSVPPSWKKYSKSVTALMRSAELAPVLYGATFGNIGRDVQHKVVLTRSGAPVMHGNAAVAKYVFDEGLRFAEDHAQGEDGLFAQDVLFKYKSTVFIKANLVQYMHD